MLIAPVKNEKSEVILFILNFEELNETLDSRFSQGIKSNILLQQIGMPFISSIFNRNSSTSIKRTLNKESKDLSIDLGLKESRIKLEDEKVSTKKHNEEIKPHSISKSAGKFNSN